MRQPLQPVQVWDRQVLRHTLWWLGRLWETWQRRQLFLSDYASALDNELTAPTKSGESPRSVGSSRATGSLKEPVARFLLIGRSKFSTSQAVKGPFGLLPISKK